VQHPAARFSRACHRAQRSPQDAGPAWQRGAGEGVRRFAIERAGVSRRPKRMIRKSSHRLALMLCLALVSTACVSVPSFAQGLAAQSAKINELGRAGKYSEAIPLAQAMVTNLDKGTPSRDLAGAMHNMPQLSGDV